ncbi:MAG: bile acid:sodium symporter [Planctomycetaceae bacterium]|jgi:sodium/bile acid cotransporter 7|nr:bile acid:sodium symporter [Planctomycetaceae bacterium]
MKSFFHLIKLLVKSIFRYSPNIVWLLGLAIFLAYLSPCIGSHYIAGQITNIGLFLIFFGYGIGMSPSIIWRGIVNWKLHIVVLLTTFLTFPLVVLVVRQFFVTEKNQEIWLGIFYIAALPSTISSSVVMVSIAGGNIPAAIFNASISGIVGVFITPIWMSLLITGIVGADNFSVINAIGKLMIIIILPITLGMCCNKKLANWTAKNKKILRYFDQSVILFVVYTSFSKSFANDAFDGFAISQLAILCVGMILLFFCIYGITLTCCKILNFNNEDTIAALFCGSKKSLGHGITMSKVIFAEIGSVGIVLLPIILYHALQLIVVSIIAKRYAETTKNNNEQNKIP